MKYYPVEIIPFSLPTKVPLCHRNMEGNEVRPRRIPDRSRNCQPYRKGFVLPETGSIDGHFAPAPRNERHERNLRNSALISTVSPPSALQTFLECHESKGNYGFQLVASYTVPISLDVALTAPGC